MTYFIRNKISGTLIMPGFNDYWRAEETIRDCFDCPPGYTFKSDCFEITDENEKPVQKPEEEHLPYCISSTCGEVPESLFHADELNDAIEYELYVREKYFDTLEDAEKALQDYLSIKINHKSAASEQDLIDFKQYFIEDNDTREVLKLAEWSPVPEDWRGGYFNEYDCYNVSDK